MRSAKGRAGSTGAVLSSYGRSSFTINQASAGYYAATTASAHPVGATYAVLVTPRSDSASSTRRIAMFGAPTSANITSTAFEIRIIDGTWALVDTEFSFLVY